MNYFHERKNAYLHNTSKVTPKNNLVESSTQKDIFSPHAKYIFSAHAKRYFLCTRKKIFSLHTQKDIFSPQVKSDRIICWEKEGVELHVFFFSKENSI